MDEDERLVRATWRDVRIRESNACLGYVVEAEFGSRTGLCDWRIIGRDEIYAELAWSAAAAFTRERLEEIRQLREEIAIQQESIDLESDEWKPSAVVAVKRTLSRLESILTDKQRGIRQAAEKGE